MTINLCLKLLIYQLSLSIYLSSRSICSILGIFSEISGDNLQAGQRGKASLSIIRMCMRQGIEKSGEGARLWGKTEAHWRGMRNNSVWCGVWSLCWWNWKALSWSPRCIVKCEEALKVNLWACHSLVICAFIQHSGAFMMCWVMCQAEELCGEQDGHTHCLHRQPHPKAPLCRQDKSICSFIQQVSLVPEATLLLKLIPLGGSAGSWGKRPTQPFSLSFLNKQMWTQVTVKSQYTMLVPSLRFFFLLRIFTHKFMDKMFA